MPVKSETRKSMFDWRELTTGFLGFLLFWCVAALALGLGWMALLRYTLLAGDVACIAALTLSSLLLLAAVRSARRQRARRALLEVSPTQWRDGQAVAVAGRLGSGQVALKAPVSGQACSLYQHQMRRRNNDTDLKYGRGLRLADAALATPLGSIELKGLPQLENLPETRHHDLPALQSYARHLLSGAVELAGEASAIDVLGSRDKLRAGFDLITERGRNADGQIAHELVRPQHMLLLRDPIPWDQAKVLRDQGQIEAAVTLLAEAMHTAGCEVGEQMMPPNGEVVVFGTWYAGERRLAIGPSPKTDRHHALVCVRREAWLAANRRGVHWRIGLSLALLFAIGVPLLTVLKPSIDGRPWAAGLVSLSQLWQAMHGNPEALWPLLGSTTRPDTVAQAIEAQRDAEYLRIVRERGATEPPPRPSEPPEADRLRAIEYLLRFKMDLNAPNDNGRLLLIDTRGATLDLLLSHGADPRRAGANGWTPLHASVGEVDPERVETLLRAGADPQARDDYGNSALDHALADAAASKNPDQATFYERVIALLRRADEAAVEKE